MPINPKLAFTRRLLFGAAIPLAGWTQMAGQAIRRSAHAVPLFDGDELCWFQATSGVIEIPLPGGERLELACIPEGTCLVGAEGANSPPLSATPVRRVNISAFFLGQTEVTIGQYLAVLRLPRVNLDMRNQYSLLILNEQNRRWPVAEGISHQDATEFCARVKQYSGYSLRLPSEAEWEYACRAGTTIGYYFGDRHDAAVVVMERFAAVASKPPNRFGLYDMHGLSLEWCEDWFHADYVGAPPDGRPWRAGAGGDEAYRMIRSDIIGPLTPSRQDSARRSFGQTQGWASLMGFRVALDGDHSIREATIDDISPVAATSVMRSVAPGQLIRIRFSPGTQSARPQAFVDLDEMTVWEAGESEVVAQVPHNIKPGLRRFVIAPDVQSSMPASIPVVATNPGLFVQEDRTAAALNEGGALHSPANPIARGKIVSLFGDGLGATAPERVIVTLAGVAQAVEFFGPAPGLPPGVVQVNVRIADRAPTGAQPVRLVADGSASAPDVWLYLSA